MGDGTCVVAGGAGFLGSHLCDALLDEGWRVLCVDNLFTGRERNIAHLTREPRFDFLNADVTAPLNLQGPIEAVFNLACPASPPHYQADPVRTLLVNVQGTHQLLQLAAASGARLVQASTSEVYGDPEIHPQNEEYRGSVCTTGPRACYDEGKRAAETLCADFRRSSRVDARIARIFNTYGPRMRADDGRVVSNVVCQALADADITVYGDGQQTRSFCFVSDLIDGLMRLMSSETADGMPINLGNPAELTIGDLVRRVVKLTGTRSKIVTRPLPVDDPRRRRPDIRRAKRVLGWRSKVRLAEGLPRTVEWFAGDPDLTCDVPAPSERGQPFPPLAITFSRGQSSDRAGVAAKELS
jgi:UDP-glucuronate decarboxylase